MSNNTLAVPTGTSLVAGEGFACGSCVDLTYGSTFSLGAASATSEYVKDGSDAILSPNVCFGNSSAFMFGSSQVLDPSFKCKDIPWLKVSYFIGKVTKAQSWKKYIQPVYDFTLNVSFWATSLEFCLFSKIYRLLENRSIIRLRLVHEILIVLEVNFLRGHYTINTACVTLL